MNQTNRPLINTGRPLGPSGMADSGLPPLPAPGTFTPGKAPHRKPENPIDKTEKPEKLQKGNAKPERKRPRKGDSPVHEWFLTFMCMNIPIIGWIYLLYLAFNKKKTERRNFARAYLLYKLAFLIIAAIILGILTYIGLGLLDQLMAYMEML